MVYRIKLNFHPYFKLFLLDGVVSFSFNNEDDFNWQEIFNSFFGLSIEVVEL